MVEMNDVERVRASPISARKCQGHETDWTDLARAAIEALRTNLPATNDEVERVARAIQPVLDQTDHAETVARAAIEALRPGIEGACEPMSESSSPMTDTSALVSRARSSLMHIECFYEAKDAEKRIKDMIDVIAALEAKDRTIEGLMSQLSEAKEALNALDTGHRKVIADGRWCELVYVFRDMKAMHRADKLWVRALQSLNSSPRRKK